jgi:hypothetical protein
VIQLRRNPGWYRVGMANTEQLAKLKEGVEAWNAWRNKNPKKDIDLREADLGLADLTGANLDRAYLHLANLNRAHLNLADLREAILIGAYLNLASLRGALLSFANLSGADLGESLLLATVFGDANLTDTKGLDSCVHEGPSVLNHATLMKSGMLPLPFLRGCGLPDNLISYLPSLLNQAIQYYSCFISYSTNDQEFASRLHADLQDIGVRCWFAPEDLKIGDEFRKRIDESIRLHDKLLIILSENSIQSRWVATEVEAAFEREHRQKDQPILFPIRLDAGIMQTDQAWAADIRRRRHIGDFSGWKNHDSYKKAFDLLIRDLQAKNEAAAGV